MISKPFVTLIVLFTTALILIQSAAALTIEQAPFNPAFVAYTDGQGADYTRKGATACYGDSCPTADTTTRQTPYATGLLPAPGFVVWPDEYVKEENNGSLPAHYDLRDEGRVTPVGEQGLCGSCWAFATYGSLESTYLTVTGEAENFSENNMNSLCSNLYPDGFDYKYCDGGEAFMSTAYLTRGSGPVQEADDPYRLPMPSNISPTDLPPVLDVLNVTFLPPRTGPLDNDLFKQTLMDEGAILVSFLINESCFADNYTTYYWPGEEYAIDGGHSVTLVGWNDTFSKDAFAVTPPGNGAFILKNSWGSSSGDEGYFYISYYDPIIGYFWDDYILENNSNRYPYDFYFFNTPGALYTGVPADADKLMYQHDPLGWTTSIGTGMNTTLYGANVFTAEGREELTNVSFYTREPGTNYTVSVFTNVTTPPVDATPVTQASGTCNLPGYHTIPLTDSVPLMPDEEFSVVLEVSSPNDTYPLVVEEPIYGYSSGATAGPGESYVSTDGETWADLTEIIPDTNLCIKAHASPVTHVTVVPQDYQTIMEAVNASVHGDTIIVENGTYPEELVLDKPLTLQGVGTPVIVTPENGIGVGIEADGITISGFTFDGNGTGRVGMGILGDDCTISETGITGYGVGLFINRAEGLSLSTTALQDNGNNIEYVVRIKDPGNSINGTVTVNGRPVIYREGVSGETINASSDAGAVICVNCTDIIIRDTTTGAITDGTALHFCRDVMVENVTADEVSNGVRVDSSDNVTIQFSSFGPDMGSGIRIEDVTGFRAEKNEIICHEGGIGISLGFAEKATILNNTIDSGKNGIGVGGRMLTDTEVTGNTVADGARYGIAAVDADNMTLTGNMMNASSCGIAAENMSAILVSGNTIRCNDTGPGTIIEAEKAEIIENTVENSSVQSTMFLDNSVVRENRFSGALYPEIKVWNGTGDVFVYRNDFILTGKELPGDIFGVSTAGAAVVTPGTMGIADILHESGLSDDETMLQEPPPEATDTSMTGTAEIPAQASPEGEPENVTWNSPENETYWYNGVSFTQRMGNYWSTYNGTDTDHDGIGNTPFRISETGNDTFPLVKPAAWYLDEKPKAKPEASDDDDASAGITTSHALSAGDSVTLTITGPAVQAVTVTAAEGIGQILLTMNEQAPARTG